MSLKLPAQVQEQAAEGDRLTEKVIKQPPEQRRELLLKEEARARHIPAQVLRQEFEGEQAMAEWVPAHQVLQTGAPRKRGRPRKQIDPIIEVEKAAAQRLPVGLASPLDGAEWAELAYTIPSWECVQRLDTTKWPELFDALTTVVALYRAVADLQKKPTQKKGRKPTMDVKALLIDCARVWGKITGQEPAIWRSSHYKTESVSVELAREVYRFITGRGLTTNLNTQIDQARVSLKKMCGQPSEPEYDFFF